MRTPRGAKAPLSARSELNGQQFIRWATDDGVVTTVDFAPYPRKVDMPGYEDSLLLQMWQKLDTEVEKILMPRVGPENELSQQNRAEARIKARGMAELITLAMAPFLPTADDVVKAAVARHKSRQPDGEPFETPGLAEHIWDPTKNFDGSDRVKVGQAAKKSTPKATGKKIPDSATASAKSGVESGMFTVGMVAKMYSMTEAEVKAQLGLP